MEVSYGLSNYDRDRGNLPELPVVNMFAEQSSAETKTVLQSRPGLENYSISMGTGPIRGLYRVDGVLSNALFGISNNSLYSGSTLIGNINGTGHVSIDGFQNLLFICAGASLWAYNGTTLSAVSFPDGAATLKVVVGASRAVVIRKDTQTFYWSNVLTSTISSLNFASAENSPDKLLDLLYLGDTLILFGTETVEFWPSNSSDDDPFLPLKGRVFQTGIKNTGCATIYGNSFAWITNDNEVCLGNPDTMISDLGLNRRIADSTSVTLWRFWLDSIEFLAVTTDNQTDVYCPLTQTWSVFSSYNETNWLAKYCVDEIFGSIESGQLYTWSDGYSDFDSVLERRFRAWVPIESGGEVVNNLRIRTNQGQTTYTSGDYSTPVVEMRTSRDAGMTFNNWKSRSLGAQGKYAIQVQWNGLGMFSYPGAMAEFRVTDPVPFRVSNVLANEPYGGINGV